MKIKLTAALLCALVLLVSVTACMEKPRDYEVVPRQTEVPITEPPFQGRDQITLVNQLGVEITELHFTLVSDDVTAPNLLDSVEHDYFDAMGSSIVVTGFGSANLGYTVPFDIRIHTGAGVFIATNVKLNAEDMIKFRQSGEDIMLTVTHRDGVFKSYTATKQ